MFPKDTTLMDSPCHTRSKGQDMPPWENRKSFALKKHWAKRSPETLPMFPQQCEKMSCSKINSLSQASLNAIAEQAGGRTYFSALRCCTPAFRNTAIQITLTFFTALPEIPNTTGHYSATQFHYSVWLPTIFAAQLYLPYYSSSSSFNFFSLCSSTICKLEITKILSTQFITAHFPNTALEKALRSTS